MLLHASLVHSEYYVPFAVRLAAYGVESWLPDLRGHGRSAGVRGHSRTWDEVLSDVGWTFAAMTRDSDLPAIAGGESYGALLAYSAVKRGLITPGACLFMSPAFGIFYRPSPAVWWLLRQVGLPVLGHLRPLRTLPAEGITRDPAIARALARDPLCNRRYTLGFLLRMMIEQHSLDLPDQSWTTPALVLLSEEDPITDNDVSRALFAENPAVQVRSASGGLHSLVADQPLWAASEVGRWLADRGG
jgi:alpha-beta hydrolase superfamily lysophospholipase